ncbi:hypothetical protein [Vibrio algarum]|uniref:Uncharacterized protein n=1 Tax=Vibrio algarum TaxID=3020714 RepID=A0ABT4YQP1_9VIBR|nr:hypothetical protein [Vibrio sp. KJ40-1]MDB1123403.1 hypothetical protein [Vibrio sp. KJ40-1]
MSILIKKLSYKSFISARGLDSFQIASILMLIAYSTNGRANYIYINKLHFLFDLLICDQTLDGFPKFTIPPWNIDKDLKNKLIVLSKNGLICESFEQNKVRYSLTDEGFNIVQQFEQIEELSTIRDKAQTLASTTTKTMFEKSKVIF